MPNYVNPMPPVGPKGSKKMEEQKKKMQQTKPSFGTPAPKPQQTAMGKAYNAAQKSVAKPMAVSPKPPKPMAPAPKAPKSMPMAPAPMPKKKK
jgi:hypothetical protein